MGTVIATGVIAVLGTLMGAVVSGLIQRRVARDGLAATERAALRRDQIAAISELAAAAADHRRTSVHRRVLAARGVDAEQLNAATAAVHGTRSAMAEPLARVRLLLPDPAVQTAVEDLATTTFALRDAEDIEAGRLASIAAHDHLLTVAAESINVA